MELEEYLQNNNVTLWRNNRVLGPQQTKSLADFDYAEGLENITGKMVWICDYRANADPTKKPIRGIEPTPVVVTDAKETNKTIYYSPIYFRPVKNGHIMSKVIAPMDNTGYRGYTGESVNIFYTVEDCVKCYREQVRQANEIYEKEKARIIKEFDARMQILDNSLTPFNDVPQSDYTVTVKADATNNDLPYSTKDRGYRYEVSKSMTPEKYAIEKFKSCVLRGLADELRANTQWMRGAPISLTFILDVYVDGMQDITQTEMMPLTLTL